MYSCVDYKINLCKHTYHTYHDEPGVAFAAADARHDAD